MYFSEVNGYVRVQDASGEFFKCPVDEFLTYESSYVPLSDPFNVRVWNMSIFYVSDGLSQVIDLFYSWEKFSLYCSKIEQYQSLYDEAHQGETEEPLPSIFAHIDVITDSEWNSETDINGVHSLYRQAGSKIQIEAKVSASQEPLAAPLLINKKWNFRVRKSNGSIGFIFSKSFVSGVVSPFFWEPGEKVPSEIYTLEERDFETVSIQGQEHQIQLVTPVIIELLEVI